MNAIKIMVKGWVKVLPFYLFALLPLLVSCSESEETSTEFENWQSKNETYFLEKYNSYLLEYQTKGEASSKMVVPAWSMPSETILELIDPTSCILVEKVMKNELLWTDNTPEYTDSVAVHYRGNLIPSSHFPEGYEFDRSYMSTDNFNLAVDVPSRFAVSGNILPGFSTALQHMHRGEGWIVTIPYQLGYGTTESGVIPAYSTLVFEIFLMDFWDEEEGDRY
jgi:FKBP-type peptidyl-prolyl cis-trans isomerase FklB